MNCISSVVSVFIFPLKLYLRLTSTEYNPAISEHIATLNSPVSPVATHTYLLSASPSVSSVVPMYVAKYSCSAVEISHFHC